MVGYVDDTTIYAVIPRLLSRQVIKSLKRDFAAIHSWCLKWHTRLNPTKTNSTLASSSQTYAPCSSDLTLGGAGLEEIKRLRIIRVIFNSTLMFETHLRKFVSKAARSLCIVHWAEKLFDCPRVLKSCFDAYVLCKLEHYANV